MLLQANQSCLLVVDVQEKLISAIHEYQRLVKNCVWLIQVAQILKVPVLVSEQYPKGLGATVKEIANCVPNQKFMQKMHFSCASDSTCLAEIEAIQRSQIILVGIEAHVCIQQTAIELAGRGKNVFVVADAVDSRNHDDAKYALKRMRQHDIQIITKEMALFEWAHISNSPEFKILIEKFLK